MEQREFIRKQMLKKTKEQINEKFAGREIHIIKAVNLLSDLDSISNLMKENASEWKVRQPTGEAEKAFLELETNTKGIEEEKTKLTEFIQKEMSAEFPNFSVLATPIIGAKLLATAGSKKRLCFMPASTIQILGAEKALFAHLRKNAKSPKHGHLFNHPLMQNLPRFKRGKAARILAGKLAIALKQDYFNGENTSAEVKKEIQKRFDEIIAEPVTEKQEQKERDYDSINNERRKQQFDKDNKRKEYRAPRNDEEGEAKPVAEHKTFTPEERKAFFQKKGMGSAYKTKSPARPGITKPSYGSRPSYGGGRSSYGSDRPSYGGGRSTYGASKPYGTSRPYGASRPGHGDHRPSYETQRMENAYGKPAYGERADTYSRPAYRARDSETSFGHDRTQKRSFGKGRFNKPAHGFKKKF
ncbi:MAG: hypothetical protein WCW13_05630 [archaeon]|jgi:hypothetical protein